MTNHPTGDTALSRAITTGAPVATNDAQAAELQANKARVYHCRKLLSIDHHRNGVGGEPFYVALWEDRGQKFLVTYFYKDPSRCACAAVDVNLAAAGNIAFGENSWRGDHWQDAMLWAIKQHDNDPTPTPRPTPGGEFTTRGSTVYRDDTSYAVCVNPRAATSIARRLNAADAMEKALKDIDNLPFHATHAEVIAIVMRYKAALRGGA